jgi:hypothetical protein
MTENPYWSNIKTKFLAENDFSNFKNWEVVRYVPIYAEYQFEEHYGPQVIEMILSQGKDIEIWKRVLEEPFDGHNIDSYNRIVKHVSGIKTSPWALKSAHHILTYLTNSGKELSDYDQIVEFGPGIGETARVICDLGFSGNYYLYDLPEVYRISGYYNRNNKNVSTVDHYSKIDASKKTLFISTWAISEVPFDLRYRVFSHFESADYLLIYQNTVFEYNNEEYFKKFFPNIVKKPYLEIEISFLNHIANGNKYLITK